MNPIADTARRAFDAIFCDAARANFGVAGTDEVEVKPATAPRAAEGKSQDMLFFTITSFRFKLIVALFLSDALAKTPYFSHLDKGTSPSDVLAERGNMTCGAMSRQLEGHFSHLGLSTPSLLRCSSQAVLEAASPSYVSNFTVVINQAVTIGAALCVWGYAPLDFVYVPEAVEDRSGVIEFM